jgi:cytochrome c biogenesis protein CcmG, thiol:disulfide interchange protein DsbE
MNRRHRIATVVGALALVTAACGDDEPVESSPIETDAPADPTADATADATDAGPTGDGPNATVAPDLPEELAGEVGPLEVVGTPLPPLGAGTAVADDPALGMAAPILVGRGYDGSTVRIDATENGPTMVVFLAHWCPHCNSEVPRINELRDAGSFPADLNIVAVSTAIDPTRPNFPPSPWLDDLDWTYDAIPDGVDMQAQRYIGTAAFGVDGFPFVTLIGADGTVAARWSGEHETDELLELVTSNLPA